jgi:hypothetical protein
MYSGLVILCIAAAVCYCEKWSRVCAHKKRKKLYPVPGETWTSWLEAENPWPSKDIQDVKILDVKSDWVKYSCDDDFDDEMMRIPRFMYLYVKKKIRHRRIYKAQADDIK